MDRLINPGVLGVRPAVVIPAAFGAPYLMTYHWLVYFSAPVGLPFTLVGGLAAAVMTVRDLSKGEEKSDEQP